MKVMWILYHLFSSYLTNVNFSFFTLNSKRDVNFSRYFQIVHCGPLDGLDPYLPGFSVTAASLPSCGALLPYSADVFMSKSR